MRVLAVSVTRRGQELAARLPFERAHGNLARTVRDRWETTDCFVLFIAAGAAVRIVAPLIARSAELSGDRSASRLPSVVCVDDAGKFAVPILGGHLHTEAPGMMSRSEPGTSKGRAGQVGGAGTDRDALRGANDVAREISALLGAVPVVTTASDVLGVCSLDAIEGLVARGDVAGVSRAMIDGARPIVENRLGWPLPPGTLAGLGDAEAMPPGSPASGRDGEDGSGHSGANVDPRVIVTDADMPLEPGVVLLHPPSIVAGVGTSTGATLAEVEHLLGSCLEVAGISPSSLAEIATAERRAHDPAIEGLGMSVRSFATDDLTSVKVPTPSSAVAKAVGTPSVAEAAALLAAGPGGRLLLAKRKSAHATVALARRGSPRGSVSVVGIGPGGWEHRTPAAVIAIRNAAVVIGYGPYLDACSDLIGPHQDVERYAIGEELLRVRRALEAAERGHRVALVCSGDAGVYGMASLLLEESERASGYAPEGSTPGQAPEMPSGFAPVSTGPAAAGGGPRTRAVEVHVVPGVTASLAAAATLGAPLANDYLVVSLSDHLTPWQLIEARILAAAAGDLTIAVYNPRSGVRDWQLGAARDLLLRHRSPETPVGVVTNASRPGEKAHLTTLANLDTAEVSMTSCVIIGSSRTRVIRGQMVTPRGYLAPPPAQESQV